MIKWHLCAGSWLRFYEFWCLDVSRLRYIYLVLRIEHRDVCWILKFFIQWIWSGLQIPWCDLHTSVCWKVVMPTPCVCLQGWYICLVAMALAARTYCDVWVIQNGTSIERSDMCYSRTSAYQSETFRPSASRWKIGELNKNEWCFKGLTLVKVIRTSLVIHYILHVYHNPKKCVLKRWLTHD